jgi:hypothetical protein
MGFRRSISANSTWLPSLPLRRGAWSSRLGQRERAGLRFNGAMSISRTWRALRMAGGLLLAGTATVNEGWTETLTVVSKPNAGR